MARGFGSSDHLTQEDKDSLNHIVGSLTKLSADTDNKLGASIVLIVRNHLRTGNPDAAAVYLATMLEDINTINNWYAREVNVDLASLRKRILNGPSGR